MPYNPYYPNPYLMPPAQEKTNGNFISVSSENDVISYPVAPGNCMTFKIEGRPIVMEKVMSLSNLESPKIKKYKLVEEEVTGNTDNSPKQAEIDLTPINDTLDTLKAEIKEIWGELEGLKAARKPTRKKGEEDDTE